MFKSATGSPSEQRLTKKHSFTLTCITMWHSEAMIRLIPNWNKESSNKNVICPVSKWENVSGRKVL